MTDMLSLTPAQRRMVLTGIISDGKAVRVTNHAGLSYDLSLIGLAQHESEDGADPYSQRSTLLIGRFYATGAMLALRIRDIASVELLELSVTDPNHPDYVAEQQVVKPIPREALAARKVRQETRHDQK